MRLTFRSFDAMMPLCEMVESPFQTNRHSESQIKQLAKMMDFHGVSHPINITKGTNRICFGHARREAALLNGWSNYPVVYHEFSDDSEEKVKVTSDNAIGLQAELDLSTINTMNTDLGPDLDIELWGLKNFEIEPAEKQGLCDEDEVPEHVEPKTKLGDIYQLGAHRLMCGDSTSINAVEKLLDRESIDMAYCDPPYGADIVNANGRLGGDKPFGNIGNMQGKAVKAGVYRPIIGDATTETAKQSFNVCAALSKTQIFWGAQYYAEALPPSSGWIVWDKQTDGSLGDGELAYTNQKRAIRIFQHKWSGMIKASERAERRCHPTQKPVALAEWCFENYGKPTSVLDLFGGSGSTLIACEKTGRRCFMSELDPYYVDQIIARWERFTGQKALLL